MMALVAVVLLVYFLWLLTGPFMAWSDEQERLYGEREVSGMDRHFEPSYDAGRGIPPDHPQQQPLPFSEGQNRARRGRRRGNGKLRAGQSRQKRKAA
jgi:hypothetical protein